MDENINEEFECCVEKCDLETCSPDKCSSLLPNQESCCPGSADTEGLCCPGSGETEESSCSDSADTEGSCCPGVVSNESAAEPCSGGSQENEEKFVLKEFIEDFVEVFPEYLDSLNKYKELNIKEFSDLNGKIYAENFFDILYKNDKIFDGDNINYLPGVDFSKIWKEELSDKTRENIWKYLQLILFSILSNSNNSSFMENVGNMDNLNFNELSSQIENTINNMSGDNLPDADKINDTMKGMLSGKLGNLAKEIANESTSNLESEEELNNMLKDPTKLFSLVKNVGDKIDTKIKNGELNESELLTEATELLGKMNNIPGMGSIQDMMKNMGFNMNNMNMNATENKVKQHEKKNKTKERLRKKLEKRKKENSEKE